MVGQQYFEITQIKYAKIVVLQKFKANETKIEQKTARKFLILCCFFLLPKKSSGI